MSMRAKAGSGAGRAALVALTLAAAGVVAGTALPPRTAQALPTSCVIRIYYRDADMTEYAGTWSNCPGSGGLKGHRTRYYQDDRVELEPPRHVGGGGGGLPCEFIQETDPFTGKPLQDPAQSRCYNLPIPRP